MRTSRREKSKTVKAARGAFTVGRIKNRTLELLATNRWRRGVTAGELLNSASSIDKFLLPSEEGVAGSANTDFQVPARGTGMVYVTASTGDGCLFVAGMNVGFHVKKREAGAYAAQLIRQPKRSVC